MNDSDLINRQKLEQLKSAMSAVHGGLGKILDIYLEEAPQLMGKLKSAIDAGNAPDIRLYAHSLKSQCATMGAEGLSEIFRDIEVKGKSGSIEGYGGQYAEAESQFQRVHELIRSYKSENT